MILRMVYDAMIYVMSGKVVVLKWNGDDLLVVVVVMVCVGFRRGAANADQRENYEQ